MTITQITHNIGNYIINTDMNITIDKENKRIVVYDEMPLNHLVDKILELRAVEFKEYTIAFPPKEIQYIPIYPASPTPMYPYPVYPYPAPCIPSWGTIVCNVSHT